jgi:hypothetical protein
MSMEYTIIKGSKLNLNNMTQEIVNNSSYICTVEKDGNSQLVLLRQVGKITSENLEEFSMKFNENVNPENGKVIFMFQSERLDVSFDIVKNLLDSFSMFKQFYKFLIENKVQIISIDTESKSRSAMMYAFVCTVARFNRSIPKPKRVENFSAVRKLALASI